MHFDIEQFVLNTSVGHVRHHMAVEGPKPHLYFGRGGGTAGAGTGAGQGGRGESPSHPVIMTYTYTSPGVAPGFTAHASTRAVIS